MYSLIFLAVTSFLIAFILTPLCRNIFLRLGLVDHPDQHRKLHVTPIPRVGGIAIVLAITGSYGLLLISPLHATNLFSDHLTSILRMAPAGLVIFAVGLLDDLLGLRARWKLVGQVVASVLAYFGGVNVVNVMGNQVNDWWWSFPLTVLWLVLCTNSFNLIDGVDGLASGVGLFATLTILAAGLMAGNVPLAMATVPLAGALAGFLKYNFNPATIFLGDSGSLLIGFLLGCFGVVWSQKAATLLGMTAPLMALAIPLLDSLMAIVRRFLRRQPIFGGDRGHIHHKLLDRGLSPRRAVLILYAVSGIFAVFSLLTSVMDNQFAGVVLVMFCGVAWIGIQNLGYVEFNETGRMLLAGAFRQMLEAQLQLRATQAALAEAQDLEQTWSVICDASREFGFGRVELELSGQYYEQVHDAEMEGEWRITIPIGAGGSALRLIRSVDNATSRSVISPFADLLHKHMCNRFRTEAEKKVLYAVS